MGAGEAVSIRNRLSQKIGKRTQKGEREREGETGKRTLPSNIGSTQKARAPF